MIVTSLAKAIAWRYRMQRDIGAGGMAAYLAQDIRHNRNVALKVLHPELSAVFGSVRLLKEIELGASLQRPHILPLLDSREVEGQPERPPDGARLRFRAMGDGLSEMHTRRADATTRWLAGDYAVVALLERVSSIGRGPTPGGLPQIILGPRLRSVPRVRQLVAKLTAVAGKTT